MSFALSYCISPSKISNHQIIQSQLSFNCPLTFLLAVLLAVLLGSSPWLGVLQNWDENHQTIGTSLHHRCYAISEPEDLHDLRIAVLPRHNASWDCVICGSWCLSWTQVGAKNNNSLVVKKCKEDRNCQTHLLKPLILHRTKEQFQNREILHISMGSKDSNYLLLHISLVQGEYMGISYHFESF